MIRQALVRYPSGHGDLVIVIGLEETRVLEITMMWWVGSERRGGGGLAGMPFALNQERFALDS